MTQANSMTKDIAMLCLVYPSGLILLPLTADQISATPMGQNSTTPQPLYEP